MKIARIVKVYIYYPCILVRCKFPDGGGFDIVRNFRSAV